MYPVLHHCLLQPYDSHLQRLTWHHMGSNLPIRLQGCIVSSSSNLYKWYQYADLPLKYVIISRTKLFLHPVHSECHGIGVLHLPNEWNPTGRIRWIVYILQRHPHSTWNMPCASGQLSVNSNEHWQFWKGHCEAHTLIILCQASMWTPKISFIKGDYQPLSSRT